MKRRTNVIGRFHTEMAALSVVFGVLEEAVKSLDSQPIAVEAFQAVEAWGN